MDWAFIAGVVTGAMICGAFSACYAFCEWSADRYVARVQRTIDREIEANRPTAPSLLDRHTDVGRFCEHGGLAGPGARII